MAKHFGWILAAVLLCGSTAVLAGRSEETPREGQSRPPHDGRGQDQRWKWWINPDDRKEFGITDQQSAQIEQIFDSTMPNQRAKSRELEKLEEALSKTIKEGTLDVATLTHQVSRVEMLRAELTTNRTVMLYRIMQVLTPDQRPKIEALIARRAEARRRQQAERDKDKSDPR